MRRDGSRRAALTLIAALLALCTFAAAAQAAPVILTAPVVKGKTSDGKKLKVSSGRWTGKPSFSYAWERCEEGGGGCVPVSGSGATHQTTDADVGHRLRAAVTATDAEGSATATSAPSAVIAAAAPHKKKAPAVTGTLQDGQLLSAANGTWLGTGPLSYSYRWESCSGSACTLIAGAVGQTYRAASADIGRKLRVIVTATNAAGGASATSKPSAVVAEGPPVNTAPPAVAGLPVVEQTLSAEPGSWAGTGPLTYTYQWRSCNLLGECEPISGATGPTYTVGPLQIANSIEVEVTAHGPRGSASATSETTNLIKALLPSNLELPSITGLLQDGGLLAAITGAWSGSEPLDFSYVWELCDSAGLNCKEVSGALGGTLGLLSSMVGDTVRVIVTATNSAGSTSATSEPTSLVAGLLPSNIELPSIGGLLQDGSSLLAALGSWSGSGPISFSKVWELCDAAGQNCKAIEGAVGSTLALISSEIGDTVRLAVTATNVAGSKTAYSEPTSLIKGLLPSNTGLPSITGLLQDGASLTGLLGSWAGSGPLSFSRVWELCDSAGNSCAPIEGAIGSTLALISGEIGDTVRLAVTATNVAGSKTAYSEPTSAIGALLPSNLELPSISGLLQDGSSLSALLGSWGGSGPLSFSKVWELCDAAGQNCKAIEGAVGSTLALITSEIGHTLRLAVTATNSGGSKTAYSEPTSLVKALLPSNTGLPSITGLLQDGSSLTGLLGSWAGSGPLSFSRVWELCDSAGNSCAPIEGAVGSTLALISGEIGKTVRLAVTATNVAGSKTAYSEPTSAIGALLPSNLELPSIGGLLQDGSSLSALLGSWGGSGPLSFSKVWELCDAAGQNCKAIEGAVGSTLGLITSEIGHTLRLAVTATNSGGSKTAYSEPTSLVKALLPSNSGLPSIVGSLIDGSTLTGAKGSWTGSEPSFSYQWLLCNSAGASCKEVSGAVGSTVGLLTSMIGSTVRLAVTATNSAGSTTATSEPTSLVKALLPSSTTLPSIVGSLIDGSTLTGAKGSWAGSEPSFSYQWLLCNSAGASCKEVSGAVGSTVGLLTSMIGSTVRLAVTATNSAGSTTATSEPTSAIKALLPSNTGLPSIAGLAEDGQTLTGAKGSWTGSEPSFSYQWLLCNSAGASCKEISGAVGSTVGLLTSMIGSTVRLAVTATNSAGSTTATSAASSSILAILPANTTAPAIAGILQIGHTIEALTGKWSGSEPFTFTYQWQTCGLGLKESECTNLKGAVEKLLKLELAQVLGLTVRVLVTATNSRGSQTVASPISLKILGLTLDPVKGSTAGGTEVTLAGPGISSASAVHFGSKKATEVEVVGPDEITVTAPPSSAEGTVPVTVSTPEGSTHETPEDQFTYEG